MKNSKNTIFITVGILAVAAGLIWLAQPSPAANQTAKVAPVASALIADETRFDFGTISMAKGKVSRVFKVRNSGNDPIVVSKLYTSCMCTVATLNVGGRKVGPFGMAGHGFIPTINETVAPRAEAAVEVVFDPAAHGPAGIGRIERVVYVENNGASPLQLSFAATVTP